MQLQVIQDDQQSKSGLFLTNQRGLDVWYNSII